jgi:hypothetical protein
MKKIIITVLILLCNFAIPQNDYMKDRLTIGVFNWLLRPSNRGQQIQNYIDLNINYNLSYTYRGDEAGSESYLDGYNAPSDKNNYIGNIKSALFDVYGNTDIKNYNKQKVSFERAKIIRGASGQRSTYQAEYKAEDLKNGKITPGYGYLTSQTGEVFEDNESGTRITVRRCLTGGSSQKGFIVKDLYENMEQINKLETERSKVDMKYFWSDKKEPGYFWVVKPRIKIKTEDFNNPAKQNDTIIRVDIHGFDDKIISSIGLLISDLKITKPDYNGEYIETFYELKSGEMVPKFKIDADALCEGVPGNLELLKNSKVDYSIYWPGYVDVWLDYVRLDDKWAHFLFTDPEGTAYGNDLKFHQKIEEEVRELSVIPGFGYFYFDEYAYNNYPCISEVNRLIKSQNPNTGLISLNAEAPSYYHGGGDELRNKPNISNPDFKFHSDFAFIDTLICSGAVTDAFATESYPFGYWVKYPKTLELQKGTNPPEPIRKKYIQADNNNDYNDNMNIYMERLLEHQFSDYDTYRRSGYAVKKARLEGKDLTVSISVQLHTIELTYTEKSDVILREPTNEEISFQYYMALIYGAKQIMGFCFNTDSKNFEGNMFHNYGLLEDNNKDIRKYNYYGQPKWKFICDLNSRVRKIGEVLYPTDKKNKHLVYDDSRTVNTNYQNYHPGIVFGLPFKYIADIKSVYRGNDGKYDINNLDDNAKRYWEIGFFNPPENDALQKSTKYFLVLNKRCSPPRPNPSGKDDYGDFRMLQMKFDFNGLKEFDKWEIIDPQTNETILTIKSNSDEFYTLGEIPPGEGKLFKISPVR